MRLIPALALFSAVQLSILPAFAWEIRTHRLMSLRAFDACKEPVFDKLKSQYGIPEAWLQEDIAVWGRSNNLRKWLGQGAMDEDAPDQRVINHFHTPLFGYDHALQLPAAMPLSIGNSSLLWSQFGVDKQFDFLQRIPPIHFFLNTIVVPPRDLHNASWQDARQYFLQSLTGESATERERNLARTFNSLGHLSHLIQDACNPAHTRNDLHPPGNSDEYHAWLDQHLDLVLNSPPLVEPDPTIFDHPHFDLSAAGTALPELLPIANLIDNNVYTSADNVSNTLLPNAGVSEFSSANFLSDDTKDPRTLGTLPGLPKPDRSDFGSSLFLDPNNNCTYYFLTRNGPNPGQKLEIKHLLMVPPWVDFVVATDPIDFPDDVSQFDDEVFKEYTSQLVPRAIGYSKALVQHFFRGDISVTANGSENISITNRASENLDGTFTLYYDATDGKRHRVPSAFWNRALAAGETSDVLLFLAPTDAAQPGKYLVVFQGKMGAEDPHDQGWGAIAASTFETPTCPPSTYQCQDQCLPLDLGNGMILNTGTCQYYCGGGNIACQGQCYPPTNGSKVLDPASCSYRCATGSVECHPNICVPACGPNQQMDNTCQCQETGSCSVSGVEVGAAQHVGCDGTTFNVRLFASVSQSRFGNNFTTDFTITEKYEDGTTRFAPLAFIYSPSGFGSHFGCSKATPSSCTSTPRGPAAFRCPLGFFFSGTNPSPIIEFLFTDSNSPLASVTIPSCF